MRYPLRVALSLLMSAFMGVSSALATWSIILIDTESKEIGVAGATCIVNFDLREVLPVVRVDVGAACAQSAVDSTGANRQRIWNALGAGADPNDILALLQANDPSHQSRQYGIADTLGRSITFSGATNGPFAGSLRGRVGSLIYTVQGNVIAGECVLTDARDAILNTPGAIPEKLLAAMEAAKATGGDGRCSCDPRNADSCGCPVPTFTKSAHCGFIVITRRGDVDTTNCTPGTSCAEGDHYLSLSFAGRSNSVDPIQKLRNWFNDWRLELIGVTDAVESRVTLSQPRAFNDPASTVRMEIELRDWAGLPALGVTSVTVEHDPRGSAGSSAISPVSDLGGGRYEVELTTGVAAGRDRFLVTAHDAINEYPLIPSPKLLIQDRRADLNLDGAVNVDDLEIVLRNFARKGEGDIDGDGLVDLDDVAIVLGSLESE